MITISPESSLLSSAANILKNNLDVKVFDSGNSDDVTYPQITISGEGSNDNNRAKNEVRTSYTLSIDYYDIVNNDHLQMIDDCYKIRDLLTYLKLKDYYCQSVSFSQRELLDNSTSEALRRMVILITYDISEKSFI